MSKNQIFKNYIAECPYCGGELSPDNKKCPYCDTDLEALNKKYREGEKQIADAMDEVKKANKHLYKTRVSIEKNSFKKSKERKRLIILIAVVTCIVILLFIGAITTITDINTDKKINQIEETLLSQKVDTFNINSLSEQEKENFRNTEHQSSVGYLMENENYFKINFFADSTKTNIKYKTEIILDKFESVEVHTFDQDYISMSNDDLFIAVSTENNSYNETTMDVLTITEYTMNEVKRLDNVKLDNIVFEVYCKKETYYLIANPYPDFFVSFSVRYYNENTKLINQYNETHNTSFDENSDTLPLEIFNMVKGIKVEIA